MQEDSKDEVENIHQMDDGQSLEACIHMAGARLAYPVHSVEGREGDTH